MLAALLAGIRSTNGIPGPTISSQPPGTYSVGMSDSSHGPAHDDEARPVCLVERATGREVCRAMGDWRVIARRLERKQAQRTGR